MILDTDVLIALLNGEPNAKNAIEHLEENGEKAATTIITVYELLRGAYISTNHERNLAEVQDLLSNIEILNLTIQACEEASKIYRDLRRAGRLIGEFDTLIAAIVKMHSEAVMTRDEHFSLIQGIDIVEW